MAFLGHLSFYSLNWNIVRTLLISACIPLGLVCIADCVINVKGRLASIFLMGSMCYYIGSVLGFLFTTELLHNPFTNPLSKSF